MADPRDGLFFLFGSLLLLFMVLSWLSLLPTKANKISKNPKDCIIMRAKTKEIKV